MLFLRAEAVLYESAPGLFFSSRRLSPIISIASCLVCGKVTDVALLRNYFLRIACNGLRLAAFS